MTPEPENVNVGQLAERWWTLVLRGAVAILFGALTFALPQISLLVLVMLWAAYALVDGVLNLILAARGARAGRRWGWLVFEGIVSIAAGVLAIVWPDITAVALLVVIAAWAIVTGVAEIAVAIRLRRQLHGEWLLVVSGLLSIAFGVLLVVYPGAGILAMLWMVGAYAIVFGGLLILLGWRLHGWQRGGSEQHPGTPGTPGGLPSRA
jgi:uncharacterized membrane protein HdeD (DUF308 family)